MIYVIYFMVAYLGFILLSPFIGLIADLFKPKSDQ